MKIHINSKIIKVTEPLKKYVEEKIGSLSKIVERFEENGEVNVYLDLGRENKHHKSGDVYFVEANTELDGKLIRAEDKSDDIRKSIDEVKDILTRDIRKEKEKEVDRKRKRERPGKPKK
ncbi:MAG: ribosome-associated translation inhibitor RaiA [Candidatus Paceibacterota bacterium]